MQSKSIQNKIADKVHNSYSIIYISGNYVLIPTLLDIYSFFPEICFGNNQKNGGYIYTLTTNDKSYGFPTNVGLCEPSINNAIAMRSVVLCLKYNASPFINRNWLGGIVKSICTLTPSGVSSIHEFLTFIIFDISNNCNVYTLFKTFSKFQPASSFTGIPVITEKYKNYIEWLLWDNYVVRTRTRVNT